MKRAFPIEAVGRHGRRGDALGESASVVQVGVWSVATWSVPFSACAAVWHGLGWPAAAPLRGVIALVEDGPRLRVLVADVAGRDLEAAPLAGRLRSAFACLAACSALGLGALVTHLDALVTRLGTEEAYATACLVDLYSDGTVVMANCGHPWPLAGDEALRWRKLSPVRPSLPLGVGAHPSFDVHRLNAGAGLVLHADGIVVGQSPHVAAPATVAFAARGRKAELSPSRRRPDGATAVGGQWACFRKRDHRSPRTKSRFQAEDSSEREEPER